MKFQKKEYSINYEIHGEGKPVILLHGLSCDMNLMKGCMERIFNNLSGYKRIYIDIPGMGESTATNQIASSDKIKSILAEMIKELIDDTFILVGESYGGYLSLGILTELHKKIDSVLLICPVIEACHEKRILPKKDFEDFNEEFLNELTLREKEMFCPVAVAANPHTYSRFKEEILIGINKADKDFIKLLSENYAFNFDLGESIKNIDFQNEVLFLAGKQDVVVGFQDMYNFSNNLKRSSFMLIDKAGHNLQIDKEWLFEMIVTDFFS